MRVPGLPRWCSKAWKERLLRNGGTACGVGNKHSVTEEIGDQVDVRRFTAACAGTGKLKVCRFKLGTADSEFIHRVFLTGERDGVIPIFLLVKLRFNRFHDESLFRGGAYIGADAAAVAVFRTDDDAVFQSLFGPGRSLQMNPSGARASSSSVTMKGRMAAWGQTKAH